MIGESLNVELLCHLARRTTSEGSRKFVPSTPCPPHTPGAWEITVIAEFHNQCRQKGQVQTGAANGWNGGVRSYSRLRNCLAYVNLCAYLYRVRAGTSGGNQWKEGPPTEWQVEVSARVCLCVREGRTIRVLLSSQAVD